MSRSSIVLSILIATVGCRSMDSLAQPVVLPAASVITSIEVTPNYGQARESTVLTDRNDIDRFVVFVNSRQDEWKKPWDTFPAGMYTVTVKHDDDTVAVFWPSPGHIGGRAAGQGADSNRLRTLTNDEWRELQLILGVTTDQPTP